MPLFGAGQSAVVQQSPLTHMPLHERSPASPLQTGASPDASMIPPEPPEPLMPPAPLDPPAPPVTCDGASTGACGAADSAQPNARSADIRMPNGARLIDSP